ncbi:MAG: ribonuclease J [Mycoplasmataceae bacterium]|jgi:ribonuclease J|nr:ribonuclease J [Mycoplasmataceae bacterium]
MSNTISFLALGGLDEKGKNCYVLEINNKIFVLNFGISFPTSAILGVQGFIPDTKYLIENKDRIKGIFIGTANEKNFSGLDFLPEELENVNVYTSEFNAYYISQYVQKKINYQIVKNLVELDFDGIKVTPFKISNALPVSYGFIFNIEDSNVIYTDESVINTFKSEILSNDILKVNTIIKPNQKNLLLTSVGIVSSSSGFTSPNFQIQNTLREKFDDVPDRIIVGCFSNDIYRINSVVNAAYLSNRSVCFINEKTLNVFKKMNELKLINIFDIDPKTNKQKVNLIPFSSLKNEDKNVVVIIDELPNNFYELIEQVCDNKFENLILDEHDTFVYTCPTINGYEKKEADLFDDISRNEVHKKITLDKKFLILSSSQEDLKFACSIFNPTYIIPISALFMDFSNYKTTIAKTGFNKKNIVILSNGKKINFTNMVYTNINQIELFTQTINIAGTIDEKNSNSIFERKVMRDSGVVFASFLIDKNTFKIYNSKYECVGVFDSNGQNIDKSTTINNKITADFGEILKVAVANKVTMKELRDSIKKKITREYEKAFNKRPLVIITICF